MQVPCQFCGIIMNISVVGQLSNVSYTCGNCFIARFQSKKRNSFSNQYEGVWEMPKATLSYEALQLSPEGEILEGAYRLKLEGNLKQHIEPVVKFIKTSVPSSDRTYEPTTFEWFYHEKYHDLMKLALSGSHFTVNYTVTKEQFVELKRKQDEFAKQAGQAFQTKQYPVDDDINKFASLLSTAHVSNGTIFTKVALETWNKETATMFYKKAIKFFHPDLHPERAAQASELNEVFTRLKETYYLK